MCLIPTLFTNPRSDFLARLLKNIYVRQFLNNYVPTVHTRIILYVFLNMHIISYEIAQINNSKS